jgi:hypothetical protein
MSIKLTVTIKQAGEEILSPLPDRPVRITPMGTAGIVFQGVVYPLHAGDFIDVADDAFEKSDCSEYVTDPDALTYLEDVEDEPVHCDSSIPPNRWHVERNEFGNYLVFDADSETAGRVVQRMRESGLGVRRWDVSTREADDGHQYDWFIRLGFNGSREECRTLVAEAFGRATSSKGGSVTDARVNALINEVPSHVQLIVPTERSGESDIDETDYAAIVDEIAEQLRPLTDAAKAALRRAEVAEGARAKAESECLSLQAKQASLSSALTKQQAVYADAESRLNEAQKRSADLQADLAALRATLADRSVLKDKVPERETALRASLARAEQDRDRAQAELNSRQAELAAARSDIADYEKLFTENDREKERAVAEADRANKRLAEISREQIATAAAKSALSKPRRPEDLLASMVNRLWKRLCLHPDSMASLLADFCQWKAVFRVLTDLDDKTKSPPAERFQNLEVYEVRDHISTGRDAMGRVYYRRLPDDRLWVFIHRKKNDNHQESFVRRIAKYDPAEVDPGM